MASNVTELIGVYDADSTLLGEMSYWIKARFGKSHCALCDLTHGTFRKKGEWVACESTLGVPIVTYHRNDAPSEIFAVTNEFPVLLLRTPDGLEVALAREELDEFSGDTERFANWLRNLVSQ